MVAYTIENILPNNTYIISGNNKRENVMLELWGVNSPAVGDKILLNEELLNKNSSLYTQPYSFERVDAVDPMMIKESNDREFIILSSNQSIYTLKRIYG